jgi:hypothetical protein
MLGSTFVLQNGVPVRDKELVDPALLALLEKTPDVSKEEFTEMAMADGHSRNAVRDFFRNDHQLGKVRYENRRLLVSKAPATKEADFLEKYDRMKKMKMQ